MPGKDEEWFRRETERMSEDEVYRELQIGYALSVSGKVFSTFRDDRHTSTSPIAFDNNLPVYRIWDFGKTNAVLYAQIDRYSRKRILHERVMENSNIEEQLRVAEADSIRYFPDAEFYDICDPAGSFEDQRGANPEVETLNDHNIFPEYGRILSLPTRDRKTRGRSLITKDLQTTPGGAEALMLYCSPNNDEGCPILRKAFQGGYCFKKDNNGNILDKVKEVHPYEDVIDCLIYLYLETDGYSEYDTRMAEPVLNDDYYNPITGF